MDNTPIHPEKSKLWKIFKEVGVWCVIVLLAIIATLLDVIIEIRYILIALAGAGIVFLVLFRL